MSVCQSGAKVPHLMQNIGPLITAQSIGKLEKTHKWRWRAISEEEIGSAFIGDWTAAFPFHYSE